MKKKIDLFEIINDFICVLLDSSVSILFLYEIFVAVSMAGF